MKKATTTKQTFKEKAERELYSKIKANRPALEKALKMADAFYEDGIYRLYHRSLKVRALHPVTQDMIRALTLIRPKRTKWDPLFLDIFEPDKESPKYDYDRSLVEGYLHTRYFTEMAVKAAKLKKFPENPIPFFWASLLCLFSLR